MSQRPPITYWIVVTGTGGAASSDAANFTLAASGDSNVPGAIGQLHLQGIEFLPGVTAGNLVSSPSSLPPGVTAPHNVTEAITGPCWLGQVPGTINASTSAFPFKLTYGPLGPGGR